MISADTNAWTLAYLYDDDAAQTLKARTALTDAGSRAEVLCPSPEMVKRTGSERPRTSAAYQRGRRGVAPALVLHALQASRHGSVGFADHLIVQHSFASGADEVITFDKPFGRLPRIRRLK